MNAAESEKALIAVLARETASDSLSALVLSLKEEASAASLSDTAIGIDSTVFLRLATHPKSADIVDYLSTKHAAPIILPGQAVQEFWNNQLQAVDTIATNVRKKFDAFQSDLNKMDPYFGSYANQISDLLDEYRAQHGHVYDEATARKTISVLEFLQRRALVPYAPRIKLAEIAALRKKTKTPPGFKDEGDGDFFIWADLLAGLQQEKAVGKTFARAVLVTNDKKPDWSRAGRPHPILVAEAKSLLGIHFEIWDADKLAAEISNLLADENPVAGS